jgi:hypothetical protein
MMRSTDAQMTLVVSSIKADLASTQDTIQCLALCAIANIGGKEIAETGSRMAKEREAFLQAELTKKDAEIARLGEALAVASERVMEVQRESDAALRAKAQQLAALRSRMDDITDKFNDDLGELKRRLDTKLSLLDD